MISPTVGRVVWFRPGIHDAIVRHGDQPLAATVAYVWNDRMVNLTVSDHNGYVHSRTSVTLVQDGDPAQGAGISYCEWMPYQKGQAAKTEFAEAKLAEAR